jgi:nucleoside 2-deoxyribosyltransferase
MTASKIYLAGPGVFAGNALELGNMLKGICAEFGCEGLWPADGEPQRGGTPRARAYGIFRANVARIKACDAVVANIQPFRGPHADNGTAWEMGAAHAQGKPIFAYTDGNNGDLRHRIRCGATPTGFRDADGWLVEDFDLVDNLMIGCSMLGPYADARRAIEAAAAFLKNRGN